MIITNSCLTQNQNDTIELYNLFDKENHFIPEIDKSQFETLHSWDFGWAVLENINIAKDEKHEITLSRQFSPGQKALYFFWYLDAEVTNGGFIQFYRNDNGKYIPPILDGLKLIEDDKMITLVQRADKEYEKHKAMFNACKQQQDWSKLYNELSLFSEFDDEYYKINDRTMQLIEKYVRICPEEFMKLK